MKINRLLMFSLLFTFPALIANSQEASDADTTGQAQPKDAKPNKVSVAKLAFDGMKALTKGKAGEYGFTQAAAGGTSRSVVAYAPPTGSPCNSNNCRFPGPGCAICVPLEAPIPHAAKVTAVRCFSSAGGPPGDVPLRAVDCKADVGWSAFEPYSVQDDKAFDIVRVTYHNRSDNRTRVAMIEVDFQ